MNYCFDSYDGDFVVKIIGKNNLIVKLKIFFSGCGFMCDNEGF